MSLWVWGFYPFGDGLEVQRAIQLNDRPHDGGRLDRRFDRVDESLVNLELVGAEVLQPGQGRIAGTEVVADVGDHVPARRDGDSAEILRGTHGGAS